MILQSLFVQAPQSPQDPHPDAEQFSPDELAIRHHTFFSPWNATLLRQLPLSQRYFSNTKKIYTKP